MIQAYDHFFLSLMHKFAESMGGFFTPFSRFLTVIGEKGILFLVLAVVLMLRPKTRKLGVCLFGAIACSFLVSNLILKEAVERVRPYLFSSEYAEWWAAAGRFLEDGFSFPSGHVSAAMAGVSVFHFHRNRKRKGNKLTALLYIYVALMCFARMYLMAHFPTDCLAGLAVGFVSAYVAWFISEFIWVLLEAHPEGWLGRFALGWDFYKSKLWLDVSGKCREFRKKIFDKRKKA